MLRIKTKIFEEIKRHHEKSKNLTNEQLEKIVFYHHNGLRLTFSGFLIMKGIFTTYSFEIKSELKTKHYIGMSKMVFPYYVSEKRLILFSELDAMTIKLYGGIEKFLENEFLSHQ